MRVPKLAGGPDREIAVLGVAAPLSSRKTGYLLRAAHSFPIIFDDKLYLRRASAALFSMVSLSSLLS